MNIFARLEPVVTLKKVSYYTVRIDGAPRNLWEQFLDDHEDDSFTDDLDILRTAMLQIGNHWGAQSRYFRFEANRGGDASALPPYPRFLEGASSNLRLYCMRYSESVVILFSGAVKTTEYAQDCDHVRPHFLQANQICKAIQNAVRDGELSEGAQGELLFDRDFELIIP